MSQVLIDQTRVVLTYGDSLAAHAEGQQVIDVPDDTIAAIQAALGQQITLGVDNQTITAARTIRQARDAATVRVNRYWNAIEARHATEQMSGVVLKNGWAMPYRPQDRSNYHQIQTLADKIGDVAGPVFRIGTVTGWQDGLLASQVAATITEYGLAAMTEVNRQLDESNVDGGLAGDLARIAADTTIAQLDAIRPEST